MGALQGTSAAPLTGAAMPSSASMGMMAAVSNSAISTGAAIPSAVSMAIAAPVETSSTSPGPSGSTNGLARNSKGWECSEVSKTDYGWKCSEYSKAK